MVVLPALVLFRAFVPVLVLVLALVLVTALVLELELELVRALVPVPDCVHLPVQASSRHLSPSSRLGSHLGGMKTRLD